MSVNKVILVGNVGKDPDVKYFENGNAVANFTVATTERAYTASNGTQIPERTEWHNIVCRRGLAKIAEQLVRKGSQIYVDGKIRSRTYDDVNGVKRYITEIYADSLELLGRRKDSEHLLTDTTKNESVQTIPAYPSATKNMETSLSIESIDDTDDLPF